MYLNLYPNMGRSQYRKNDTFIYAAPITDRMWQELSKAAIRETTDGVKFILSTDSTPHLGVIIVLRSPGMTDDDCLTAAAYIRMIHNVSERLYCVPSKFAISQNEIINMVAGAPKELCTMLTLDLRPKGADTTST